MLFSNPAPEGSPQPNEESRHSRRDVAIAGVILGLLAGAMVVVIGLFYSNGDEHPRAAPVSAAEWLGTAAVTGDADTSAPIAASTDRVARYAPTPEELGPALQNSTAGDASTVSIGASIKQGTVQKGVPVITSLTRLGLSMGQAHAVISALDGIFDFRRARPGQSFEVRVDPETGEPQYFRFDVSLTEVYEVKRRGEALKGKQKHIPTQKRSRRFGGTIASSLYKAIGEMDAHPSLSGRIVEVLASEVNFYKAQRPGDTFRVIVEEESLNGTFLNYGPVIALEYNGIKSGKKRFFRFAAGNDAPTYFSAKGISVPRSVISIPLHYTRISSRFGMRFHPILKRRMHHSGVDFAASFGTPVWACQKGTVTFAARKGANGNLVVVNHGDNLISYYAHLQRFASGLKRGTAVRERQVVGYVGSTGRSNGPHLHFGLKNRGRFIDPLKYKVQPGRPVRAKYRSALKAAIADLNKKLNATPILPPAAPLEDATDDEQILGLEELE
ncbi:MAG: M23 family metallopeptidase [Myxococcota bacterium]|nr:M23 family metallopeptidase [Myxococcota bacterium]